MIDGEGRVHSKDCSLNYEVCWDDWCDFCGRCDCGAECAVCDSFFWYKTHPDLEVREDGPLGCLKAEASICRWCYFRAKVA